MNFDCSDILDEDIDFILRGTLLISLIFTVYIYSKLNVKKCFINNSFEKPPMILKQYIEKNCTTYLIHATNRLLIKSDSIENAETKLQDYELNGVKIAILLPENKADEILEYYSLLPLENKSRRMLEYYYPKNWREGLKWLSLDDDSKDISLESSIEDID